MGLGKKKKKGAENLPKPAMPLPPMPPAPGMPLPPLPPAPGAAPTPPQQLPPVPAEPALPVPAKNTTPPPNLTPPDATVPTQPPAPESSQADAEENKSNYSGLYAKKSGKPLKQVYGHIDRISQGEIGSLLDRYSDRFGHELDRDIIIMRKEEREGMMTEIRDSPTVQLLNEEEDESDIEPSTLVELNSQLENVESELRRLKPEYQAAKAEGDKSILRELRPTLEALMAERKLIKAVISGEAELSELLGEDDDADDSDDYESYEDEDEVEEDIFLEFVSIVDSLLGSNLPEDAINEFTESEGFEVYRAVGSDPANADEDERKSFFNVVDSLLGGMPDEAVSEFVESPQFEVYRTIGAMYS